MQLLMLGPTQECSILGVDSHCARLRCKVGGGRRRHISSYTWSLGTWREWQRPLHVQCHNTSSGVRELRMRVLGGAQHTPAWLSQVSQAAPPGKHPSEDMHTVMSMHNVPYMCTRAFCAQRRMASQAPCTQGQVGACWAVQGGAAECTCQLLCLPHARITLRTCCASIPRMKHRAEAAQRMPNTSHRLISA